jgi:O-antigen ligase
LSAWRALLPVAAIAGLAALWAAVPLVATSFAGIAVSPPLVPDLMAGEFLELFADVAALACGFLIARGRIGVGDVLHWLIVFGAAELLFGLALRQAGETSGFGMWTPNPAGRFGGTIGNANVEACFAAVVAILAYGQAMIAMRRRRAKGTTIALMLRIAFYWLAVLLGVGACVATASRTTTVLIIAGIVVLTARRWWRRHNLRRAALPVGLVGIIVVAVLATAYSDLLFERFGDVNGGAGGRVEMWSHYLALAERSPWFGYGLGGFSTAAAHSLTDPITAQHLWAVNSAHNLFLQLWIQAGIPYLALILLAAGWVGFGIARNLRRDRVDLQGLSLLIAILIVIGCSMVDIALDVPAIAALLLFLAGLAWGAPGSRMSAGAKGGRMRQAEQDDDDAADD